MSRNSLLKKQALCSVALLVTCIWGYRVWSVNVTAETIPRVFYEMGDWIPVEDGYIIDELIERNDGYYFRVNGAEAMSPKEFVRRFGENGCKFNPPKMSDRKTVLAVSLTIRNDDNTDGGLESFMWNVISADNDCSYQVDDSLFSCVEEVGQRFRIKEGTEHTTVFPFVAQMPPDYFSQSDGYRLGEVIGDEFTLNFTVRPVKKTARIHVRGIR